MLKRVLTLCLVLAMVLAAAACSKPSVEPGNTSPPDGEPKIQKTEKPIEKKISTTYVKDTLTIGSTCEPVCLDPQYQADFGSQIAITQMYEALIARDYDTGGYRPCLAKSWEYLDDTTIRFHLRDDVIFHDGSHFTAEDVKFTFMRGKESPFKGYSYVPFDCDACKVVDPYTFDVKTYEPFPAAFEYLVGNAMFIISKHAVESAESVDAYGRKPDGGTGPWKFKDWIAGDRLVFELNEDYYDEKPVFPKLVIRIITDGTTRALTLKAGEIDIAFDIPPSQIENIEKCDTAYLLRYPNYCVHYVAFNCQKAPLNDVRVRKAMRYALDLDPMTEVAYAKMGYPADSIWPKAMSAYEPPPPELTYTYDIEKAKALLADAGYPDGFEINLWVNENQTRIDMAEMLKNAWAQVGINVHVSVLEWGTYLTKIRNAEADLFILGGVSGGNDSAFLRGFFYTADSYAENTCGYSNPEYDRLADLAFHEMNPEKRHEYEIQIQNILRDDMQWIPLREGETVLGVRNTLTGVERQPESLPKLQFTKPVE